MRITLGLHTDLAGPYLRGYSAEYVGLLGRLQRPDPDPAARGRSSSGRAVQRSPGLFCYEVLNEPMSLTPRVYVEQYLKPAYEVIKGINPALPGGGGRPDRHLERAARTSTR